MDVHIEENQVAGPSTHAFSSEEIFLQTELNLAHDKIASLERKNSRFQRPAATETPNLHHNSMNELDFLSSMRTLIDSRLQNIVGVNESECSGLDEMAKENEKATYTVSDAMTLVFNVQMERDNLLLQLKETQDQLFKEKAQRCEDNEASAVKIKMLIEKADINKQYVNTLLYGRQKSSSTDDEEDKYSLLKDKYQRKLESAIHAMRETTQTSHTLLDAKLKSELGQNNILAAQLQEMYDQNVLLTNANNLLMDSKVTMGAEIILLEDICLQLKKRCLGVFGRRMQEREVELEKMKQKMRETQPRPALVFLHRMPHEPRPAVLEIPKGRSRPRSRQPRERLRPSPLAIQGSCEQPTITPPEAPHTNPKKQKLRHSKRSN